MFLSTVLSLDSLRPLPLRYSELSFSFLLLIVPVDLGVRDRTNVIYLSYFLPACQLLSAYGRPPFATRSPSFKVFLYVYIHHCPLVFPTFPLAYVPSFSRSFQQASLFFFFIVGTSLAPSLYPSLSLSLFAFSHTHPSFPLSLSLARFLAIFAYVCANPCVRG